MISICIPVYNCDITGLVTELKKQAENLAQPCEIIAIDDYSDTPVREVNREVCRSIRYIELNQNIGRSGIRNLFLKYSGYRYLLFIDCDALIERPDFLSRYSSAITKGTDIVCGGSEYGRSKPPAEKMLRWIYGTRRESLPAAKRNHNPFIYFRANNFMIDRDILSDSGFDERITGYGHEDTLFGYNLFKRRTGIRHIENPVMNSRLENSTEYLSKTRESIRSLVTIVEFLNFDSEFIRYVRLLKYYDRLKGIRKIILVVFRLLRPGIVLLLESRYICLYLFDFYKLGTLAEIMDKAGPE